MPLPELASLLGTVQDLTRRYKSGGSDAAKAFRDLAQTLLSLTVLDPSGAVRLVYGPGGREKFSLGGWKGPDDSLPLNDGRHLRMSVALFLEPTGEGLRLKVEESSYQYQMDREGERWVFRYDYLRTPQHPHPAAHLQIRGSLAEQCLPPGTALERIHLPVGRVSLEAVIRLLVDQFGVQSHLPADLWRPVLAASERAFLDMAHRPLSGQEG